MADNNTANYSALGGSRQVIGGSLDVVSGGDLDIESGGSLKIAGTAITCTAAEVNKLAGMTATKIELNKLASVTATTAEINKLAGVTATPTDINKLASITVTAAAVNKLVQGVGLAGAAITGGRVAVTGSTSFNTGLTAVVVAVASMFTDPTTVAYWASASAGATAGWIIVNCFKPASSADVTPNAASAAATVNWFALGSG